ncbi:MAG TPA: phosphatidylglycerophosphatase A [Chromatiales bacterium]|nr:phosphatidylglycerophosphatase A [Chromatiales bacterium]
MSKINRRLLLSDLKDPVNFVALGFGAGLSKYAPGTVGTLVAVPLYLLLEPLSLLAYVVISVALTLVGIWLCDRSARTLGVHDHPGIVWDEIAGYLLTMIAAPSGWQWVVLGFILFRLFDIWKPWPIKAIDRKVDGGLGIMLDDVVAALFAWLVLYVIALFVG